MYTVKSLSEPYSEYKEHSSSYVQTYYKQASQNQSANPPQIDVEINSVAPK